MPAGAPPGRTRLRTSTWVGFGDSSLHGHGCQLPAPKILFLLLSRNRTVWLGMNHVRASEKPLTMVTIAFLLKLPLLLIQPMPAYGRVLHGARARRA